MAAQQALTLYVRVRSLQSELRSNKKKGYQIQMFKRIASAVCALAFVVGASVVGLAPRAEATVQGGSFCTGTNHFAYSFGETRPTSQVVNHAWRVTYSNGFSEWVQTAPQAPNTSLVTRVGDRLFAQSWFTSAWPTRIAAYYTDGTGSVQAGLRSDVNC